MARKHMMHTWTSSVASPKFNLELDTLSREVRRRLNDPAELFRLGILPLLLSSSSVPSNCSCLWGEQQNGREWQHMSIIMNDISLDLGRVTGFDEDSSPIHEKLVHKSMYSISTWFQKGHAIRWPEQRTNFLLNLDHTECTINWWLRSRLWSLHC